MYDARGQREPLEPLVIRVPAEDYIRLKRLAAATRVRQSEYLREAIAALLEKYQHLL